MQESPPTEIYRRPNSRFVASFIGQINFVEGRIREASPDGGIVATPWGDLRYSDSPGVEVDDEVTVAVRPENVWLDERQGRNGLMRGTVSEIVFLGEALECRVDIGGTSLGMRLHPSKPLAVGDSVALHVDPDDVTVLVS